jgi:hypothetical protein
MKIYEIEMMNESNYDAYMSGSMCYHVHREYVEANTPEEAVEIAQYNFPSMIIHKGFVKDSEQPATIPYSRKHTEGAIRELRRRIRWMEHDLEKEKKRLEALEKGD